MLTRGEEEGTKVGSFDSWIWILWVFLTPIWILSLVLTLMDTLGNFDTWILWVVFTHIGPIWLVWTDTAIWLFKKCRSTKKQNKMNYRRWVLVLWQMIPYIEKWCERNFDEEEGDGLREKLSLLRQYKQKSNPAFQRCDVRVVCQMQIQACWGLQESCRVSCIYLSFDAQLGLLHKSGRILLL